MSKRQLTMADLAKTLGISTATVSRALKDYPDISQETKQRVLDLVQKLNYRPNSFAANLRKNESRTIGVIIPEIVNHFFSLIIKGIMEVAYEKGYRVMLCQSDESYEKEVADAEALLASRVDGLMVSLSHETLNYDHFRSFKDLGIPVVFFDKVPKTFSNCSKVIVNDHEGAFEAVKHMISQGRRRIAHIGGPFNAYTSMHRLNGYKAALTSAGIPVREELILECRDVTMEEGYGFISTLLELPGGIDGVFCVTDQVAIGAMASLKAKGVAIPKDVAVIGFSDWKMAAYMDPPLSSVYQPGFEMGKIGADILVKEIAARRNDAFFAHEIITLQTSLRLRESSLVSNHLQV